MCGIIGIVGKNEVATALYDALTVLQHRGQDAADIATYDGHKLHMVRGPGLAVSLTRTNGDPTNTTAFTDAVVNALLSYRPGILRMLTDQFGDSLDNQIAPPFGRQRSGYSSFDWF